MISDFIYGHVNVDAARAADLNGGCTPAAAAAGFSFDDVKK